MKKIILPTISSFLMGFTVVVQVYTPMVHAQVAVSQSQQKLQRIQALARVINGHGLMYSLYLNPVVEAELQGLASSNNAAALDLRLLTIANRMASDLSRGRVLPTAVADKAPIKAKAFAHQVTAANYLNGSISLEQFMANVTPKNRIYIEALTALKTVADLKAQNKWAPKPTGLTLVTIKKGISNPPVISYARAQLANFGYANNTASTVLDAELDSVIRAFQTDNALVSDGIAGQNTWKILDKSVDQLITQGILNVDRTRWLPDQNAAEYIYVNLALQTFQYFENENETMSFRTINGRLDRQTPMLIDVAREVVLNPTWTVPRTIFVKDKLPKLRESAGYAAELHARVYSDITGKEVDPYSVNWNQEASRLPYTLVQSPGPWNALGRIKFPLTNDFAIYLHDTNERGLFAESSRLRSSGCVRLQKPFDLGAKLLAGTKWTSDTLLAATEFAQVQAEKPTNVSLKRSVPVYLAYKTLSKSSGKLISSNDPYAIDAAMYSIMFSGK
jgi:murein L,D-transpeptidase YcbB/YkuD